MALQKFPAYLKTDPVLLTLCSLVIVELIRPMKYICFFPKSSYEKGDKGNTLNFKRKSLQNQTPRVTWISISRKFPACTISRMYLACGMLPKQLLELIAEVVKKSGLCFVSCCQEMPITSLLFIEKQVSLICLFTYNIKMIFLKVYLNILKSKKIFKNFFNTYSNTGFPRQVKTQGSLCFKVPQTEKELKHTYSEV